MNISYTRWAMPFVYGVGVAGGLAVVIWVYRALGGARYGYQLPATGAAGGGFDSVDDAIGAAGDYVDAVTEVE